jgi:hypothetical protein
MKSSVIVSIFLTAVLVTLPGDAQSTPNFSGDWKMNIAMSNFGSIPVPDVLTRTIRQNGVSLEISTRQKGASGDVTTELKYTTDGKVCSNKINGSESKGTAKWLGETLIIESTRQIQDVQITSKEVWALSNSGKALTINNHLSIPQQGEFDLKLVLEKQ